MLCLLGITITYGQNIKSKTIAYTKTITPTLLNLEQPIDMSVNYISSSNYIKEMLSKNYITNDKPYYINNNTSNPKYIAIVNYIYNDPYTKFEKGITSQVIIKSKIDAVIYLLEAGKGVFDTDTIHLTNNSNNDVLISSIELASTINKSLLDKDLGPYLVNGVFPNPAKVNEVNLNQLKKITEIANSRIKNKLTSYKEETKINFNYLKEDKIFSSIEFNKALELAEQNVNPINAEKITEAIRLFQAEFDKYENNSEKKIKNYKIAILENILRLDYLINNYNNTGLHKTKMENIDKKNYILNWYLDTASEFEKRISATKINQPLTYTKIPDNLLQLTTHKNALQNNPSDESNFSINDVLKGKSAINYPLYDLVNSQFELNNFIYYLEILENKTKPEYQDILMDKVILYIQNGKFNAKKLSSSTKNKMKDFFTYCDNFNQELIDKSVYKKSGESKESKYQKIREYISENDKTEEFTKFIPNLKTALIEYNNKIEKSKAYQAAINLNSIVKLRNILEENDLYEKQRKENEDILNQYLEDKTKNPIFKGIEYFEFKKTIDIFDKAKNSKVLTDEDIENYQILLVSIAMKYI